MINKARCKAHPARKSVQVGKDASREGNKVVEGDGKTGMEYKQVKAKPLGSGKVIDWNEQVVIVRGWPRDFLQLGKCPISFDDEPGRWNCGDCGIWGTKDDLHETCNNSPCHAWYDKGQVGG